MIRMCALCALLACVSVTAADDHYPLKLVGDLTEAKGNSISIDEPLFDYPISRAIGIDIRKIVTSATKKSGKPSPYDLAPGAIEVFDIQPAPEAVVYYDGPVHLPRKLSPRVLR